MARRDVIVIGASADGVQMLRTLIGGLPADLDAAVFVVLHSGPLGGTLLPEILARAGDLPVAPALDGEPIVPGRVYLPHPDCHLLVKREQVRVFRGPRENGFRPAIDPLFRSAARAYGSRVVGVILTGLLDDGAYGLSRIVAAGGAGIVQDPAEAAFPDMPRAALRQSPSAEVLPIGAIAKRLVELSRESAEGEAMAGYGDTDPRDPVEEIEESGPAGEPTQYTCPDCGGTLSELVTGNLPRYRCHVGHGYTAATLLKGQEDGIDEALWQAYRILQESSVFRRRMADRAGGAGLHGLRLAYERQGRDLEERAAAIARVLAEPLVHGAAGTAPSGADREGV